MRTLLLADESTTVQRVIALTFADGPVRVVSVADGRQAIERMAAQKPDIVLAGTTLPQVNGYDLAKFVRSKAELKHVPVLLLSGAFETVDEARLASSGANGVIEKPVEPTAVIKRVKELLGLTSDAAPPPAAGRLITSATPPAGRNKLPTATPPRAVTSTIGPPSRWQQLRDQTLEPGAKAVEEAPGRGDYKDLDAAFDTLDQHLAGTGPARNPAGPLAPSSTPGDPRSPGRPPATDPAPVYEVDDEWFAGESQAREDARAGRREMQEELGALELPKPAASAAPPAAPIYEVDDEWFKENDQARAARQEEQRLLAKEMGIHEVELPEAPPAPGAAAPAKDLDFDFGLEDLAEGGPAQFGASPRDTVIKTTSVSSLAPVAPVAPPAPPEVGVFPEPPVLTLHTLEAEILAPVVARDDRDVADDFAALLAFEQGEPHFAPRPPAPPVIHAVPPEITDDMLDQIALRVAERLNAGPFGDRLREAMAKTVGDTVRAVVAETSERLVREEIDRIRSKKP